MGNHYPTWLFQLRQSPGGNELFFVQKYQSVVHRLHPFKGSHLRPRLTPRRLPLRGKPWVFGGPISHRTLATHSGILTSVNSNPAYTVIFAADRTLPYQLARRASIRINPNALFLLSSFGIIREMRETKLVNLTPESIQIQLKTIQRIRDYSDTCPTDKFLNFGV